MTDLTTFQNAEVFGISFVACTTIAVLLVTHPRGLTWMKNHGAEDAMDAVRGITKAVLKAVRRFVAPGRHARPLWMRTIAATTFPVRFVAHYAGRLAESAGLITSDVTPAAREVSR